MRRFFLHVFVVCGFLSAAFVPGQSDPRTAPPKYEIPKLKYPTADTPVISYNIMDFPGADNTGKRDMAPLIRLLLKRLEASTADQGGVGNGGVLFLPEGKYLLESNIIVPKGVTLRGEWKKPEKGRPIVGTILMTDLGRGTEDREKSLIILQPAAAVVDMAFWYPKQNANRIVPYPPTIAFGQPYYFGNEYDVARNITLVNAYSGCVLVTGGGAPNMFGIYGTPLKRGIQIDMIAEVGRVETADFSPDYWIGSGLPNAPKADVLKKWLRANGTGIIMARNDWSFVTGLNVEGYRVGYHLTRLAEGPPNGQNYKLRFSDCRVAVLAENVAMVGAMFHDVRIDNCDWGLFVPENASGVLQATHWTVNANQYAIATDQNQVVQLLFGQSTFNSGKIEMFGGTALFLDSDFATENPQLKIGSESRVVMAGNRFSKKVGIINRSIYECRFDGKPIADAKKIPEFPYKDPQTMRQKPDREVLYVATAFGVKPNDNAHDNTGPLQKLLDQAASDGGGVVYLPPGKYRCLGHLTVPAGVELKGATDVGTVPTGPGSVLEVYEGKGNPDAPPFLTMQERSGLRGIVFDYPEQDYDSLRTGRDDEGMINPHAYPYAIRVAGKDVYLVHPAFRATFSGIDLFTHKADNVYIEYPAGHLFTNGIRVGGGTDGARICNAQFNTIGYACGNESKFGRWANGTRQKGNVPAYRQNWRDLRFFILEDCTNLFLLNNFHFGTHIGTLVGSERGGPSGLALGHGIDSAVRAVVFERIGEGGFDFIGSQIVALSQEEVEDGQESRYLLTTPNFTGTVHFFAADFWGLPKSAVEVGGGQLNMVLSRFDQAGREIFFEATPQTQGRLHLFGNSVKDNRVAATEEGAKRLYANFSMIEARDVAPQHFGSYTNNISNAATMTFGNMLNRTGWRATANGKIDPANMLDGKIDTRWGTGQGMKKDDWIAFDLRDAGDFNTVVLHQGASGGDYVQEYEAFVSTDGKRWGKPVVTGRGTPNATVIRFPDVRKERYVKIAVKEPRRETNLWWSVAEMYAALLRNEKAKSPF